MVHLQCSEVWGGIKNEDVDVCSPGLNVSLYSSACDGGKGGDVYFFSMCSADNVTRIALADVVGHGEQVSQISQWVYEQMATRLNDPNLAAMMVNLNERVASKGLKAMTTAVVLSYYRDLQRVYYCYAGHPPMLTRTRDGEWHELLTPHSKKVENLPFGVAEKVPYTMNDTPLAEHEILLIYSDGVLEAPNRDRVQFGMNRLRAALCGTGNVDALELKRHVINRLCDWTGGPLAHDDVTLMAIELDEHGGAHGT